MTDPTDLAVPSGQTLDQRLGDPDPDSASEKAERGWWRDAGEAVRRNLALAGVLIALLVIGAVTRPDIFTHVQRLWDNEITVLTLASSIGVVTVGMTFVMIGGGIDLSVGAILALASVWCTTVATQSFGAGAMVFAALAVGACAGLVNGVLISFGRLVPFIATLAMMVAARGLAQKISGSHTQINTVDLINGLARDRVLGVPQMVIIFFLVVLVGGCCSTAPRSAAARSRSVATPRLPGLRASTCVGKPCCCTSCRDCAPASRL